MDEKRFISDNTISFAKNQADIIRNLAPDQMGNNEWSVWPSRQP
ncbi:hypothetical protein [Paenibacillus etheri]